MVPYLPGKITLMEGILKGIGYYYFSILKK